MMLDGASTVASPDKALDVQYRVRHLSLHGEVSTSAFANEADARDHQQALIESSRDGLVLVERVVRVDDDGGPERYEVTAIAREAC